MSKNKQATVGPGKLDKKQIRDVLISTIVGLAIYFMPQQTGLTLEGQKSLAIFIFSLLMWILRPIEIWQTSIISILLLPLTGAVESQKVAFGTLGYDIIWLMVAAFVLTSAMSQTNLGNRMALSLVTRFGGTPTRTLFVLLIVNFILAFFVPSTTARASLLLPIAMVLLEIYKVDTKDSNFAKLTMLQGVQNNAFATSMVMTATSAQVLAVGFINDQAGGDIGYIQWLLGSLPQALITAVIMFLIGRRIYDYSGEFQSQDKTEEIQARLRKQLDDLGPMSSEEKRVAFIFGLTLFLWATGDYHMQMFGFEISTEQTAVIAMLLCFLPGIGVLKWDEANIKWDLMVFSAGAYAAGNALNDSGGASWIIEHLVQLLRLDSLNPKVVAVILIAITVYSHLIFTSKTVRTTILIPAIISIAKGIGLDPVPLALACAFGIAYTITLPPHSKVNALYFGSGYFTVRDELTFGLIACGIGTIAISLVYFFWLPVIL